MKVRKKLMAYFLCLTMAASVLPMPAVRAEVDQSWIVDTKPTLNEKGKLVRDCQHGGSHGEDIYILPELNVLDYEYEPVSCTGSGKEKYIFRKDEQEFSFEVEVERGGKHNYGDWEVTVAPTKETEGKLTRTCKNDENHKETFPLPKLDEINYTFSTTATCETGGTDTYIYNKDGNTFSFKDENGQPAGHDYGDWEVITAPTKECAGSLRRTCKNNENHTDVISLPKLDKINYTFSTTATCEEEGKDIYTYQSAQLEILDKDGNPFSFEVEGQSTGHAYGNWKVTTAPTKEKSGELTRICKNNESHTEKFSLPKLDKGNYVYSISKKAGCVTKGIDHYTYRKDGQEFSFDVEVKATGHKITPKEVKKATAKNEGSLVYQCTSCGHIEKTLALPRTELQISLNGKSQTLIKKDISQYKLELVNEKRDKKYVTIKDGKITAKSIKNLTGKNLKNLKTKIPVRVTVGNTQYTVNTNIAIPAPTKNEIGIKRTKVLTQGGIYTKYQFTYKGSVSKASKVIVRIENLNTKNTNEVLDRKLQNPKSSQNSYIYLTSEAIKKLNNKVVFKIYVKYGKNKSKIVRISSK